MRCATTGECAVTIFFSFFINHLKIFKIVWFHFSVDLQFKFEDGIVPLFSRKEAVTFHFSID